MEREKKKAIKKAWEQTIGGIHWYAVLGTGTVSAHVRNTWERDSFNRDYNYEIPMDVFCRYVESVGGIEKLDHTDFDHMRYEVSKEYRDYCDYILESREKSFRRIMESNRQLYDGLILQAQKADKEFEKRMRDLGRTQ